MHEDDNFSWHILYMLQKPLCKVLYVLRLAISIFTYYYLINNTFISIFDEGNGGQRRKKNEKEDSKD